MASPIALESVAGKCHVEGSSLGVKTAMLHLFSLLLDENNRELTDADLAESRDSRRVLPSSGQRRNQHRNSADADAPNLPSHLNRPNQIDRMSKSDG